MESSAESKFSLEMILITAMWPNRRHMPALARFFTEVLIACSEALRASARLGRNIEIYKGGFATTNEFAR